MRRVAIIGSGQVGMLTAHGFLQHGWDVTVYSDRTADDWLSKARPTGTAGRFELSMAFERSLGLNYWEDELLFVEGAHLSLSLAPKNPLVTVAGRLEQPGCAIDVRLQSHRWMNELEARGGRIVVESVSVERLDAIAAENDLTVVATGKAALAEVFPRDAARSRYDRPARNVCCAAFATDRTGFDGVPYVPVKFDILAGAGEAFFAPFFHKDVGAHGWTVLVEAVPGGPLDRFMHVRDGQALLDVARQIYRDNFPWGADMLEGAELADENGWLVGALTPTVREPVGRLPSGRVVTAVGDAAMLFDPVGGQGANNGNKMARNLVERAVEHGDRPLDAAWMRATFERFYARHGGPAYEFNCSLLEPPSLAALTILIAQYGCNGLGDSGRQRLADAFANNFDDPLRLSEVLASPARARALVTELTGMPWYRAIAESTLRIARAQLRHRLGRPMGHPSAPMPPERRPKSAPQAARSASA